MVREAEVLNFLNPDTFTSGLIDDVDLTIQSAVFEEYDFEGKATHGNATCAKLTLVDDDGNEHEQYYPAGQSEHWLPSDDGKTIQPVTGKKGINKNSAMARFIQAAIAAGFPKNKLSGDITIFEGYKFHFKQVSKGPAEEGGKEKTVLLPPKIVSAPGEKGGKKAAGKSTAAASSKGSGSGSSNGEVDSDIAARAIDLASKALENGALSLDALGAAVFKLAVTDKKIDKDTRKAVVDLVQNADWISEQSGPKTWVYNEDAGTVEAS